MVFWKVSETSTNYLYGKTLIITVLIIIIITAIGLSPGGSGYFTCNLFLFV